jgi:hypothetical protein
MPVDGDGLVPLGCLGSAPAALFVQSTMKSRMNRKTCSLLPRSQLPSVSCALLDTCEPGPEVLVTG